MEWFRISRFFVVSCFLDSSNSRYPKLWNETFFMLWSITMCPSWINDPDLIAILHIVSCKVRAFPSFDFPVSEKLIPHHMSLLDQRSISYRDFTTSWAFVMLDQWSMISLWSMTHIKSWFRISRFHRIEHLLSLTFQSAKSQSLAMFPMHPTFHNIPWSKGPDQFLGFRISQVPTPCSVDSSNVQVSEILVAFHVSFLKMDGPSSFRIL